MSNPVRDQIVNEFVDELIDACLFEDVLAMHRAIKLGYFHIISPPVNDPTTESMNAIRNDCNNSKFHPYVKCVKCNSKVAATRYASHLSNCMGLGRNSSRRANRRIMEQNRMEDLYEDKDDMYREGSSRGATGRIIHSSSSSNIGYSVTGAKKRRPSPNTGAQGAWKPMSKTLSTGSFIVHSDQTSSCSGPGSSIDGVNSDDDNNVTLAMSGAQFSSSASQSPLVLSGSKAALRALTPPPSSFAN
ncbi:hypothetical protein Ciccas_011032 [Cichlidogyrus casuarinus]|uniref:SAGA-associated factor 11 n=1 Tax=Cichlidogyrus casuarinus TaxID=1844966 RepID=A0ABD2PSE4_9PLAT